MTMDRDLLSDILADLQPSLPSLLIRNLSERRLTSDGFADDTVVPNSSCLGRPDPSVVSGLVAPNQAAAVISKIEEIFESFTDCILDERKELMIRLKLRGKPGKQTLDTSSAIIKNLPNAETRTISFPSKSPQEAWKFTALLRILELSHEALVTGTVTTKRDLYYRDPELFRKQGVVDRYVDDLAYTLGVDRDALNVVAAAKGLVAGSLIVMKTSQSLVDFRTELEGMLVPNKNDIVSLQLVEVRWVLVIEKEATFHSLATSQYWRESVAGKGILITAKGYPDIKTRQFLHLLSIQRPDVPISVLADFDPDGIGIMSTYKYGSIALAHENEKLAVPETRWLGIRSSDIFQNQETNPGLLRLTRRDRRIAIRMLEKDLFLEGGKEEEWRRELQVMLMLNIKAEIQILSNGHSLRSWLDATLASKII